MVQVTSGLRSILSNSWIYDGFQSLIGARRFRQFLVATYVQPLPGHRVLDIGCGTAAILDCLFDVEYYGYDISQTYIDKARNRYGKRGHFVVGSISDSTLPSLTQFDVILALGLIHHLNDDETVELMGISRRALAKGGRFISVDPCIVPGQPTLARALIECDRGRNVRDEDGYCCLARTVFDSVRCNIVDNLLRIPYTHIVLECRA